MMLRFASTAAVAHASILPENQWGSFDDDGLSLLQMKKSAVVDPGNPNCFIAGDGTSTAGEILLGDAADKQGCLDMVWAARNDGRCPLANGATLHPSGVGPCYCENGWTGTSGSNGWITCGKHIADEAEAVGDPHITTITGHTFDMGQ